MRHQSALQRSPAVLAMKGATKRSFFVGLLLLKKLPDVGFLAATVGDRGCEGSTVLRRHHIVDYRIYRRAKRPYSFLVNQQCRKSGGRVVQEKT